MGCSMQQPWDNLFDFSKYKATAVKVTKFIYKVIETIFVETEDEDKTN